VDRLPGSPACKNHTKLLHRSQVERLSLMALYPPFQKKLDELVKNCAARGMTYIQTSGLRSYADQDKIYAQGRTAPGKVVTQAKGGQSIHNFGCAADFVAMKGKKTDWDVASYAVLKEEAEKLGLESGGSWKSFKDWPHVQLPLQSRGFTLGILDTVFRNDGLQGVYDKLDKVKW
jgi:D-alanyl-D-alanine carboxypeptidase